MKIGILGGGQLARMLGLAAHPLGITTLCIDPAPHVCASPVTSVIQADYQDPAAIAQFASQVDLVTFENENVPVETALLIQHYCPIYPSISALQTTQDRLLEKQLFNQLSIATPLFHTVESLADLEQGIKLIGLPAILKTRRFGYDGKGQYFIRTLEDIPSAWEAIGNKPLILEQFIAFETEVSIISARDRDGQLKHYPLIENMHQQGILRLSSVPFKQPSIEQTAQLYAQKILEAFDYVGILTIEFFVQGTSLIANEMAPRVHNSGHWTIEGASTSQFENHLRAIAGLPLGSTALRGHSVMVNLISEEPALAEVLKIADAHYHTYQKEAKTNRKLGHITLNCNTKEAIELRLGELQKLIAAQIKAK